MTLKILQSHADAIMEQSRREYPDEACGVIMGPIGSDHAQFHKPMINSAHSPTFYEFDSKELLALYREADDKDEEIVVIYHSHTETEAYPSRTDIAYASEPNAHYVLVSTRKEIAPSTEFRSYRIIDGVVSEETVEYLRDNEDMSNTLDSATVEVRIPTILRPYTKNEKIVSATGATLSDLITSLDSNYPGLGERLLENGELRRFINIYVNDEDVRFMGSLGAVIKNGDSVTILPAVAGGQM